MQFPKLTDQERRERLSIPLGKLPLIIDTDAKNEIDDQFAIAWALRSPERFDVRAVYAAPFSHDCFRDFVTGQQIRHAPGVQYAQDPAEGMEQSYGEIVKLYGLLGESPEGHVFHGSQSYVQDTGKPVDSEAARDLVERAMQSDEILYVAAIGAITDIASAIMMEPEIIRKIVVVWLGGQPRYFGHGIEFNLMQDAMAARIVFECGVPLVWIPCMNVASLLSSTEDEVRRYLCGKNPLADYLAQNVLDAFQSPEAAAGTMAFYRRSYLRGREDQPEDYFNGFAAGSVPMAWSRIIWDISTIAFLKNPGWCPSTLVEAPSVGDDLLWREPEDPRHLIRAVNYCHRDLIFGDMFQCL